MKGLTAALSVFVLQAVIPAYSADSTPASPHTFTANVSLVTDYYFRGITQTWHKPALQGGADYSHTSGWYAGLWGSSVSANQYPGGSLELDYYGGYNGKFSDNAGWAVGLYGYAYSGANCNKANPVTCTGSQSYDSLEWNAGLSYKWFSMKYSRMLTDWFGANTKTGYSSGSKGSDYLEFNVAYEFSPSWTLAAHAGRTDVKAQSAGLNPDYKDYKVSIGKTFDGGWNVSLAYAKSTYSDNNVWKPDGGYASLVNGEKITNPGEGRLILTAGRSF